MPYKPKKILLKCGFYAKNLPVGIDIAAGKWYNSQSNEVAHSSPCSAIRRTGQYSNGTFSCTGFVGAGCMFVLLFCLKNGGALSLVQKKNLKIGLVGYRLTATLIRPQEMERE